eukprot:gb/GEZN01019233.1/.p1 GENE.gb/GEZN01019233.1/~~gb/GEZN01019233.1/.p1  ORF type:complete len:212 (+),score=34.82 gb/GEZN01019233.1/:82-717(+)
MPAGVVVSAVLAGVAGAVLIFAQPDLTSYARQLKRCLMSVKNSASHTVAVAETELKCRWGSSSKGSGDSRSCPKSISRLEQFKRQRRRSASPNKKKEQTQPDLPYDGFFHSRRPEQQHDPLAVSIATTEDEPDVIAQFLGGGTRVFGEDPETEDEGDNEQEERDEEENDDEEGWEVSQILKDGERSDGDSPDESDAILLRRNLPSIHHRRL